MALPRVALVLVGATLGVGLLLSACAAPTDDPEPTTPPAGDVPSSEPTVDDQAPDDGDDGTVSPSLSAAGAFEACRAASADTFSGATTWQSFEESYVVPDPTRAGSFRVYIETVSHPNSPDEAFEGAASCVISGTDAAPDPWYYAGTLRFDPTVEENWAMSGEE